METHAHAKHDHSHTHDDDGMVACCSHNELDSERSIVFYLVGMVFTRL